VLSLVIKHYAGKKYGGGTAPSLFTYPLCWGEWSVSNAGRIIPGERAPFLDADQENISPAGNRTPAIQLLARRYIDWAIQTSSTTLN
jgi:hypothetical protein